METGFRRHAAAAVLASLVCEPIGAAPAADAAFRAMLDRPLFSPTRRAPPPPIAMTPLDGLPSPDLPTPSPSLALSGIITGGGGGIALVRRPQDASPIHLALGGQVDGWTVTEIRPRAIVLRRDERSVTIDLPAAPR